jgi:hypothetical protein
MNLGNLKLHEFAYPITGLAPVTPSSSVPDYISMKMVGRIGAVILVKNATTVTGSAITLKQATAVAGTSEKALSFTTAWRNIDTAAAGGDILAEFAVSSDTFTTDNTNSKDLIYVIDIHKDMLDVANGFDCVRVGTGNATAAVLSVLYLCYGNRYDGTTRPTAITD